MSPLAIAGLGTPELLIILAVLILLFGASKLPELARGSGRALRIFTAETKGLGDDDDDDLKSPEQRELESRQERARLDAEADRIARERRDDTTA
jgi:sec-independent protein translocase protein TatA